MTSQRDDRRRPFGTTERHAADWVNAAIVFGLAIAMLVAINRPRIAQAQILPTPPSTAVAGTVRIAFRVSSSPFVRAAAWVVERGATPEEIGRAHV